MSLLLGEKTIEEGAILALSSHLYQHKHDSIVSLSVAFRYNICQNYLSNIYFLEEKLHYYFILCYFILQQL